MSLRYLLRGLGARGLLARLALAVAVGLVWGCTPPPVSQTDASGVKAISLVNEDWQILRMATAHGAFTIEVEASAAADPSAIARTLIEPLQDQYAEILVYFHARGGTGDLPMLRVQWTATDGYVETPY
jgi:hypothetical protein